MNLPAQENCRNRIGTWGDRSCPELKTYVHCRNCPVYAEDAARLLDVDIPADYLAEQTRHYAGKKAVAKPGGRSVVIFRLATEWLALATPVWSEIVPARKVHSLPHRRDGVVLGLVNIRGELLICVSLAMVLGIADGAGSGSGAARLVVVQREGDRFVFPADEIAALHRFDESDLTPVPATLVHAQARYTRGMLDWQGRAVGVLDDQLLFHTLNHRLT